MDLVTGRDAAREIRSGGTHLHLLHEDRDEIYPTLGWAHHECDPESVYESSNEIVRQCLRLGKVLDSRQCFNQECGKFA